MHNGPMKYPHHAKCLGLITAVILCCGSLTSAADGNWLASKTVAPLSLRQSISREVLENYLSRSITMEGMLNGRGDLTTTYGCFKSDWSQVYRAPFVPVGRRSEFLTNIERASSKCPRLSPRTGFGSGSLRFRNRQLRRGAVPIPDWVFKAFGHPVEQRNFVYADMIYPPGQAARSGETRKCRT